jgi:SPP1 family predicted phage head-tail adaptor
MATTACKDKINFASIARNRITVQRQTITVTNSGGLSVAWTTVNSYWAQIKPMSGSEVFKSEQLQSRVTHKILIRYQADFANTKDFAAYKITYEGRVFNIRYVRNLYDDLVTEGKEYQEILAEENMAEIA